MKTPSGAGMTGSSGGKYQLTTTMMCSMLPTYETESSDCSSKVQQHPLFHGLVVQVNERSRLNSSGFEYNPWQWSRFVVFLWVNLCGLGECLTYLQNCFARTEFLHKLNLFLEQTSINLK